MGKITGFMEIKRETPSRRPVKERLQDWREYDLKMPEDKLRAQGARCMDCGIPFCHKGCPLGNIIPDWNDLIYRGRWKDAIDQVIPVRNYVAQRTTLVAEGDSAIHAARALLHELVIGHLEVILAPVGDAFADRTA